MPARVKSSRSRLHQWVSRIKVVNWRAWVYQVMALLSFRVLAQRLLDRIQILLGDCSLFSSLAETEWLYVVAVDVEFLQISKHQFQ